MSAHWNPYWDEVKDHIQYDRLIRQRCVLPPHPDHPEDEDGGVWSSVASTQLRRKLVSRYAWAISDPDTVAFVAEHAGPAIIDPMAGTGYWARLLTEAGAHVMAYDRHPPGSGDENHWHQQDTCWTTVLPGDAADTVAAAGPGVSLLLSWPPYNTSDGAETLAAYTGDRVIFIGEDGGGCTDDDDLHKLLDTEWTEVDWHKPVQWWGVHDCVFVYDRS